jgi:hypothetical protein
LTSEGQVEGRGFLRKCGFGKDAFRLLGKVGRDDEGGVWYVYACSAPNE